MRLARTQPTWGLGFADEVWWSRLAQPAQHRWIEAESIPRLYALESAKEETDPKALACYGLLLRCAPQPPDQILLRFVEGRPVSAVTIEFLAWCSERLAAQGLTALVLIWDNASWDSVGEVAAVKFPCHQCAFHQRHDHCLFTFKRRMQDPFSASIMASATPFCFCTTQKHLTVKRAKISRD
jgi:hypothetical protein